VADFSSRACVDNKLRLRAGNRCFQGICDAESVSILEKYINDKINLKVNNRIVAGKIGDVRISGNETDIDLVFSDSRDPRTVTVTNTIMTELYSDQANMIIVKVKDFEQGVKLTPELTEQTFKIN
jgi:hypothetical protein